MLVFPCKHVDISIAEHPPANDVTALVFQFRAFTIAAARVFTRDFVTEGAQRRHGFVHGVAWRHPASRITEGASSMSPLQVFIWGAGGSLAVEIVSITRHYDDGKLDLPARYHRLGFYVVRVLLAAVAGGLAVAYDVSTPFLAAHIGAATPLIIKALGESVPAPVRRSIESSGT